MSFTDIFKKSFLSGYASTDISVTNIMVCFMVTLVIAVYIFAFYRMINKNAFYNRSFNISLVTLSLITAAVILTLQSNIVISLGMVGALSIVRFRTAIKDSLDLVFLFWSISVGIICGAGFAIIAVIVSILISIAVIILNYIPESNSNKILMINANSPECEDAIVDILDNYCRKYQIHSKNFKVDQLDMVIELSVKNEREMLKDIMKVEGIGSASILAHNGEVVI